MRAHEFADQGAAGIILYAQDTGRYGLQQRSDSINDGGQWAAWGGGREPGESLEQCARRELAEESGYTGPIKLKRLAENTRYVTFLGIVPSEFEPRPDPEWKDYCWVEAGDWPSPMHPGVAAALKNIPVKQGVTEAFDQPYPLTWERGESGMDAYTKLPDGTPLEINFSDEYDEEGNEITHVEFHRSHSQNVTGEGDAQRVFATVLAAIQQFIQDERPKRIMFGADKEPGASRAGLYKRLVDRFARPMGYQVDTRESGTFVFFDLIRRFGLREEGVPQPGQSSGAPTQFAPGTQIQNRQMTAAQIIKSIPGVPYYNNVVDDWDAKDFSWGVTKKVIEYAEYLKQHPESLAKLPPIQVVNGQFKDGAHRVSAIWLLQQRMDPQNPLWKNAKLNIQFAQQNVDENFADGKIRGKSRPGRVKRSGASCSGSVTDLRARAKKYGGERGRMYHWCANMKSGKKK